MSKKIYKFFEVVGTDKFSYIKEKTWARSEKEAIKNIAYKRGFIQDDNYSYFKSAAKAEVIPESREKNSYYNPNLAKWIKRQP